MHATLSPYVLSLVSSICEDTDYVQSSPNIRLHMPGFPTAIPFHSDVLYGHSPNETNYWLLLTHAVSTNSLWICDQTLSIAYHDSLTKSGLTLDEFERLVKPSSTPINSDHPALFSFCCAQIHGSVLNETEFTRVSFDIRTIPIGVPEGVKRRGSYFKPKWLKPRECPLHESVKVTSIATLDTSTPVYLRRRVIEKFAPQKVNRELVEFYNIAGLVALRQLEVQSAQAEKWNGQMPVWYMGSGSPSSMPNLLLSAPFPTTQPIRQ